MKRRPTMLLVATISLALIASAGKSANAPSPLLQVGQPVDWWFVFKFNAESFPACGGSAQRACLFGGTVQKYKNFGQQFAFASSQDGTLKQGEGCVGDSTADPLGATFNQIYKGELFYVIWNDQLYGDPIASESSPAGHSKGAIAWNKDGDGFVLQVSTPSWPAAGSKKPRKSDGNTLGCVKDNNVMVSQHFFALKLSKADVVAVLKALQNASVVTDPTNAQLVNNGGPSDIRALVKGLGDNSKSTAAIQSKLSTGVMLISKPSRLNVPPWQMVSALLGGEPLRAATWWNTPGIPTTTADTRIECWAPPLGKPGPVEIALWGTWAGKPIGLDGIPEPDGNHAKIGVSTGDHRFAIFGDLDQQGSLSGLNCKSSQNGRGGLFYVVDDLELSESVASLISDPAEMLDSLMGSIRKFQDKWSTSSHPDNAAKLLADILFMRERWSPTDTVSPLYLSTLRLDLKTIDDAIGERTAQAARRRFDLAFDDIETKVERCRLTGTGLGGDILFDVTTVKNGIPVGGKWVYFMEKCMEVADNPELRHFPRMSDRHGHTQRLLPPGQYWMWTQEPELNRPGGRELVVVGPGKSETETACELIAP